MGFIAPGIPKRNRKRRASSNPGVDSTSPQKSSRSSNHSYSPCPIGKSKQHRRATAATDAVVTTTTATATTTTHSADPVGEDHTAAPLSRLELLPTELVQKVFILSTNLSLPLTSPQLHRHLADRFLQLRVLSLAYGHPGALTDLLSRRFFTSHMLHTCESRYGPLDLTGALLPSRLLTPPFSPQNLDLLGDLVSRGAALDAEDHETPILALRDAIKLRCVRAVALLVVTLAVRCSAETVVLAIRAGLPLQGAGGIEELLCAYDKQTGGSACWDASIWWAALSHDPPLVSGPVGKGNVINNNTGYESQSQGTGQGVGVNNMQVLHYLLQNSTPPGEVLGAVGEVVTS